GLPGAEVSWLDLRTGRPGKIGRPVLRGLFALDLDLADQQRRRNGRHWHVSRLGATVAVEDLHAIGGCQNFSEARQWGSYNIHTADQLIGASIGKDTVNDQRDNRERLKPAALRGGVAAGHLVEK